MVSRQTPVYILCPVQVDLLVRDKGCTIKRNWIVEMCVLKRAIPIMKFNCPQ